MARSLACWHRRCGAEVVGVFSRLDMASDQQPAYQTRFGRQAERRGRPVTEPRALWTRRRCSCGTMPSPVCRRQSDRPVSAPAQPTTAADSKTATTNVAGPVRFQKPPEFTVRSVHFIGQHKTAVADLTPMPDPASPSPASAWLQTRLLRVHRPHQRRGLSSHQTCGRYNARSINARPRDVDNARKRRTLAVLDSSGCAAVLPLHADGLFPFFRKPVSSTISTPGSCYPSPDFAVSVTHQFIPHLLGVPSGSAQQPLNAVGLFSSQMLSQLPTVLPLHSSEQSSDVSLRLPTQVTPGETTAKLIHQLRESITPATNCLASMPTKLPRRSTYPSLDIAILAEIQMMA